MFNIFSCFSCQANIPWKTRLCESCKESLPHVNLSKCFICSLPLSSKLILDKSLICGECLANPKDFNFLYTPFDYGVIISGLIQNFKFRKDLSSGKLLSEFLLNHLRKSYRDQNKSFPELIIPVPLFKKRLRKRGYNQSYLIAKFLSKNLKIKLNFKLIKKIRSTEAQVRLEREARLKNLKNAFELNNRFEKNMPKHIALVDDVVTTGSTVSEIAKILKKSGVEMIDVWCLARAAKP